MTCRTTQSLLVEYADGELADGLRSQVETHLRGCPACTYVAQAAAPIPLLRALPPRQTSAHFDARLTARLSRVTQPAARPMWRQTLRPAFALSVALIAVVGTLAHHPAAPFSPPVAAPADAALISQCVILHQRDIAAQPLSDPALQNVAAHQDGWDGALTAGPTAEDHL